MRTRKNPKAARDRPTMSSVLATLGIAVVVPSEPDHYPTPGLSQSLLLRGLAAEAGMGQCAGMSPDPVDSRA